MPFDAAPEADICSTCRRPLTQRGSDGECLRCLFGIAVTADDPVPGDEMDDSLATVPGTHCYGHFEIQTGADGSLQELGAGAMGVTYRAQDSVLRRVVALKVIGRSFAGDPATRARFLREARAAAQLRHPNVASVFHYGEQDGQCFYAMELVEGETLEARVNRDGPFPAALALEVAVQVTRALAAAEAQAIVHRDLKPSNIILVADGTAKPGETPVLVKVIDFGLAKAVVSGTEAPGLADTRGGFVGTPAFASPEQYARGENERVDTRSDIYSLGVTLWYLLCGKLPFVGGTLTEIQEQQTRQPLPLHQLQTAKVPVPVVALLKSMLAVSPAARPQSARELLDALQRTQFQVTTLVRARLAWIAGTLGILASVILATVLWREHSEPPTMLPDRSVAVLPFENLSPEETVSFFTKGVQDEISGELARVANLRVIAANNVQTGPPGQRDLAWIGQQLGTSHLVEGSVWRSGDQVRVAVRLLDTSRKAPVWSDSYDGTLADIFRIQRTITRAVADQLRAELSADERAAADEPPTTDPVAYDLYLRAQESPHDFKSAVDLRQGLQAQLILLEEAVARDPKFVAAYCLIAEAHGEIASNMSDAIPEERTVDHNALAEAALGRARRLKPDDGRLHLAQAHQFFVVNNDPEQARIEIDLARRTLPNNVDLEQTAGMIARNLGRWDEAVTALKKADALQPRELVVINSLARIYRNLRRYPEADEATARVLKLKPAKEAFYERLLQAASPLEARADLSPLHAAVTAAPGDREDEVSLAVFQLVLALYERDAAGVTQALASCPEPQIRFGGFDCPKAWFEGVSARGRGDTAGARTAFALARQELVPLLEANPGNARDLSLLAVADAGLGRAAEATAEGQRAYEITRKKKLVLSEPLVGCHLAVVYAWTGQQDLAFDLLSQLLNLPASPHLIFEPTYGDFRLNPIWDPLRADPRFAALIARLASAKTP